MEDTRLDLETHLKSIRGIAAVAHEAHKPLAVDLQDGYGDQLEEAIRALDDLGVVGINLEDADKVTSELFDQETAVSRFKRALKAADDAGVPDFAVNAWSDTYLLGGSLEEAIHRGKRYLEAGATTVYILTTSPAGFAPEEVKMMVDELDGRVNVGLKLPSEASRIQPLPSGKLGDLGVARISIGPQIYFAAAQAIKAAANAVFGSGR